MSTARRDEWLPIPPHFDAGKLGQVWRVSYEDLGRAAGGWSREYGIPPSSKDQARVLLMAIDMQNTFCTPGFELFVSGRSGHGAVDDVGRLCRFIYRNLHRITAISATMDTHRAIQIFHPVYWIDEAGEHPAPYTLISLEDVTEGRWWVNPAVAASVTGGDVERLQRLVEHYVRCLRAGGKYDLTIWPYHAMLGGIGHALVSSLEEAIFFHTMARQSQAVFEIKGNNPLTENYSVLRPEVLTGPDGEQIAERNVWFIAHLLSFDAVIVAGEAKSHCLAWTIYDLLDEIREQDEALAKKVYLLEDCTSPVVVPGVIDYTDEADAAFERFAEAGMHIVRSTEPLESWPDFPISYDGKA